MDLQDEILRATGGPTINDGLSDWYSRTDAESLQDAEFRWLGTVGGVSGSIQDRWIEAFGPGQINDVKLAYWEAQATPTFFVTNGGIPVTNNGVPVTNG
jgi:hypothetical protein